VNIDDVFYYESIKREMKRRLIYEYRCDERLKTKTEESTRLADTGLVVELEHHSEYCVTKKQKIPVMSHDIFSLLFYWNKIIIQSCLPNSRKLPANSEKSRKNRMVR
jgi:hypothetical protein